MHYKKTINVSFDYINETCIYIIKAFVFINEGCIYRLDLNKHYFIIGRKEVCIVGRITFLLIDDVKSTYS